VSLYTKPTSLFAQAHPVIKTLAKDARLHQSRLAS